MSAVSSDTEFGQLLNAVFAACGHLPGVSPAEQVAMLKEEFENLVSVLEWAIGCLSESDLTDQDMIWFIQAKQLVQTLTFKRIKPD